VQAVTFREWLIDRTLLERRQVHRRDGLALSSSSHSFLLGSGCSRSALPGGVAAKRF
jgi:hypothetical protein